MKKERQKPQIADVSSCNAGFLKAAVDELLTYRTPKKIIDYIKNEQAKIIIGNPPFKYTIKP